MQIIFKYVWMYLAMGFVFTLGYSLLMTTWLRIKLKKQELVIKVSLYSFALKVQLYEKHSGLAEARALLDAITGDGATFAKVLIVSIATWPIGLIENLAIYPKLMDYVRELKEESSGR